MKKNRYRVVIIEPSEIMVAGLRNIIEESNLLSIVGEFSDVAKYQDNNNLLEGVDIAIINPILMSYGKRGTIRLLFPEAKLVALLYNYVDREILGQFDSSIEVYDKISKVLHTLEQIVRTDNVGKGCVDTGELSEREKEILIAVAKGMLNKEIADQLNISIHTVMAHRKNVSRKTGIKSVSGFVVYALLNNLIEEHEVL